jgi:hypothetical protein
VSNTALIIAQVASPSAESGGVTEVRLTKAAVATAAATLPCPPSATKTIMLTISTGGENNAGIYGEARVSFESASCL